MTSELALTDDWESTPPLRPATGDFRWEGVELRAYKDESTAPFKGVSRQTLASDPKLDAELRYFEVEPGGHSTLERHEHMHSVMIVAGHGRVLIGSEVFSVKPQDLVTIAGWTWHQFRAGTNEKLGFLCLVNAKRDRPQSPTPQEAAELRANPEIAAFFEPPAH
jgi:mannose-6-phosphate isomerase-like protein (cupin superfamily)